MIILLIMLSIFFTPNLASKGRINFRPAQVSAISCPCFTAQEFDDHLANRCTGEGGAISITFLPPPGSPAGIQNQCQQGGPNPPLVSFILSNTGNSTCRKRLQSCGAGTIPCAVPVTDIDTGDVAVTAPEKTQCDQEIIDSVWS